MKIILDTDGTMTDFNAFIESDAMPYFVNNYNMKIVSRNSLEIQDIFDMDNFFADKYNCSLKDAKKYTKKVLDEFWVNPRYFKYSLFSKFRSGLSLYVKNMIKEGHDIEVHTSRDKTTDDNGIGMIARGLTRLQYALNGIYLSNDHFYFHKDDQEKINAIIDSKPDVVFEDKPQIIETLSKEGIKCFCINGYHNLEIEDSNNVKKCDGINYDEVVSTTEKLIGSRKVKYFRKASTSDLFYARVSVIKPVLLNYFKPIVLNGENIVRSDDKPLIYAPNHRSTLDPLVINGVIDKHIHWAALKRFFDGKDSIFNNCKNPFLCKLTSDTFKKLEFISIDRKKDNPDANNYSSIRDMIGLLQINKKIGIFPEGTTSRPEGEEFGYFDPSFILMAKKTNADILPITTYWFRDENNKKRVILNFGKAICIGNRDKDEVYKEYLDVQQMQLDESKRIAEMYMIDKNSKKILLKSSRIHYN